MRSFVDGKMKNHTGLKHGNSLDETLLTKNLIIIIIIILYTFHREVEIELAKNIG